MILQAEEEKIDIRSLSKSEILGVFTQMGEKSFRANQVMEWLWEKSVYDFDSMTNLSLAVREKLKQTFIIHKAQTETVQKSKDGTIKTGFRLKDNNLVEGVLIPTEERVTACISSQVGCSLSCKFCATGYLEKSRNLEASEIYDQVVQIKNQALEIYNQPLTNIVYMGMGEPLLNYKNVLKSVEKITSEEGLHIASRRITVSTAGIAKMIKKLGDDQVKFNLALSLHAANDAKRNTIMPINESNNLEALKEALLYFYDKTGTPVSFEYCVFNNFNDTLKDAEELFAWMHDIPTRLTNLIEYNPIDATGFQNADTDKIAKIKKYLEDRKVNVQIRRSRGKDIDGACGQLAGKNAK